jgi:hypothetical protein
MKSLCTINLCYFFWKPEDIAALMEMGIKELIQVTLENKSYLGTMRIKTNEL